jgi:hypothetical protein
MNDRMRRSASRKAGATHLEAAGGFLCFAVADMLRNPTIPFWVVKHNAKRFAVPHYPDTPIIPVLKSTNTADRAGWSPPDLWANKLSKFPHATGV